MMKNTHTLMAVVAVALSIAASTSLASTVSYDFDPVSGQSFGSGAANASVTLGDATFTQANAATATYDFAFGPNGGLFSNIGGGSATVLSTGGYAGANPSGAPASLTISFASTVYGLSFNFANSDVYFSPNGGDLLTATINGTPVATATPTYSATNGDLYAEGSFAYFNANGFSSITLTSTDAAGAEDLVLGDLNSFTTPVPLPAGIWLLGGGLAAVGCTRRRRPDQNLVSARTWNDRLTPKRGAPCRRPRAA
jgi:hypothetical protein